MSDVSQAETSKDVVRAFFEYHERELYAYARSLAGNDADALDLVQQTFLKALTSKALHSLDNPRAWLFMILTNAHRDLARQNKKRSALSDEDGHFSIQDVNSLEPYEEIMFTETIAGAMEQVRCGIWCIPSGYQDLLSEWIKTFRLHGTCQYEALAEIFKMTPVAARVLVQRGMNALRERIGKWPDGVQPRPSNDPWIRLSQAKDVRIIRELQRELDESDNRLSVTRNCVDHLLPKEWHVRLEHQWLSAIQLAGKVNRPSLWDQQQLSRSRSNYVIRVLSPASSMRYALRNEPGWLGEFVDRLRTHRENSALGFLGDSAWEKIDRGVSALVGDRCWMKISLRDTSLACVFTYPRVYYTRHRPTVEKLIAIISAQDKEAARWGFPWGRKSKVMLASSHPLAIDCIDDLRLAADRQNAL